MRTQSIEPSKALRTEQDVDTKPASLTNNRLKEVCRRKTNLVVPGKKNLELIEDEGTAARIGDRL